MKESYDLGVLLVHGIGAQKQGDTLLEFGEPLAQSLGDWLRHPAVRVRKTTLLDPPDGAPAHTCATVTRGRSERRILVAESWWADSFHAPAWWPLAKWLLWSIPFVVLRATDHRVSMIATHNNMDNKSVLLRPLFEVVRVIKNILSVALTLVLMIGVLLLGVLALIPRFRSSLLAAEKLLVGFIGDSYLLLVSPGRGDAMVSQVERNLAWLEGQNVRKVAILAHSQGAEVVRRVLERRPGDPVDSLITFGSGIAKLRAVARLHDGAWLALSAYLLRALAAVMTVGGPLWAVLGGPWWLAVLGPVLSPAAIEAARRRLKRIVCEQDLPDHLAQAAANTARWLDFYATSDPVPEDKLPLDKLPTAFAEPSRRIANRRSPLLDHTTYLENAEAFRAPVLAELADLVGWEIKDGPIERVRKTREEATRVLVASRYTVASLAVAAFALPRFGVGEGVWDDVSGWLQARADWVADLVRSGIDPWPGRDLLGVVALVLAALVLHGIVVGVWSGFATRRARRLFEAPAPDPAPIGGSAASPVS